MGSHAAERIGYEGDYQFLSSDIKEQHDVFYTMLIQSDKQVKSEFQRQLEFFKSLGYKGNNVEACLYSEIAGSRSNRSISNLASFTKETTVTLYFSKEKCPEPHFIDELIKGLPRYNFILLGDAFLQNGYSDISARYPGKCINLAGTTSIINRAEIIQNTSFLLGNECEGIDLACAVGVQNLVISGGGNPGRYYPYSKLTSLISYPLECYGCEWKCEFSEKHCIAQIKSNFVIKCIYYLIENKSGGMFIQSPITDSDNPKWRIYKQYYPAEYGKRVFFDDIPEPVATIDQIFESEELLQSGNIVKAIKVLKSILLSDPGNVDALNNLSVAYILEKDWEGASTLINQILNIESDNDIALGNLKYLESQLSLYNILLQAEDLIKHEKYETAENLLISMLENEPEHLDALNDLAVLNILLGKYDIAFNLISRILSIDPENEAASENLHFLKEAHHLTKKTNHEQ